MKEDHELIILDKSDSYLKHIRILLITIAFAVALNITLSYLCIMPNSLPSAGVALVLQLFLGSLLSRYFTSAGIKSKQMIKMADSARFGKSWKTEPKRSSTDEIRRLFEKIELRILETSSSSIEDFTDIAWFLVALWSVGSILIMLTFELPLICFLAPPILSGISLAAYYGGYVSANIEVSSDDIHQLEYVVLEYLGILGNRFPKSTSFFIQWKRRAKKKILSDFQAKTILGDDISICFSLGLPSTTSETIVIEKGADFEIFVEHVKKQIQDSSDTWVFMSDIEQNKLTLERKTDALNLIEPESFVLASVESSPLELVLRSIGEVSNDNNIN